jgi:hypothetical protein
MSVQKVGPTKQLHEPHHPRFCLSKAKSQDAKRKRLAMTHSHRDLQFACLGFIDDVDLGLQTTTISSHSFYWQPPQLGILYSIGFVELHLPK